MGEQKAAIEEQRRLESMTLAVSWTHRRTYISSDDTVKIAKKFEVYLKGDVDA